MNTTIDLEATALPEAAARYARYRAAEALRRYGHPVPYARVRISRHPEQGPHTVVAQISLDVRGRPVRVQAAGADAEEAVDQLVVRLQHRLDHLDLLPRPVPVDDVRPGGAGPDRPRPTQVVTDDAGHPLIRHKVVVLEALSVDEAIAEMDYRDSHFHFFRERGSGWDALVSRDGAGRCRVQLIVPAGAAPHRDRLEEFFTPAQIDDTPVPGMSADEAVRELLGSPETFLFFLDRARDRGGVLYRRYDGALGRLIVLH